MNILEEIAAYTRERIGEKKKEIPEDRIREEAYALADREGTHDFPFERAVREGDISFICECKKASPSKGLIAPDFPYLKIAREYEEAGASCISVLTEPKWFLGSDDYLREIAKEVSVPCIRKDFVVDEYMLYEAKLLGASCVLLICAILPEETVRKYIGICDRLGLSALVETHDEEEIRSAVRAGARMIGVNNRNLKDFTVDIRNSVRLRSLVPDDILFIAESGIKTPEDIDLLRKGKVNGVLIGESLMRAEDKKEMLSVLRGPERKKTGLKLKICGLKSEQDILTANRYRPDYIGFVFAPGRKRTVDHKTAASLKKKLDPSVKAVGVFVDAPPEEPVKLFREGVIDLVQLHGNEDEDYIGILKKEIPEAPVIRAFVIRSKEDVLHAENSSADLILLDSGQGSGKRLDPGLLAGIGRPFFLAGGLCAENIREAVAMAPQSLCGLDVSSGAETEGVKDPEKIRILRELVDKLT